MAPRRVHLFVSGGTIYKTQTNAIYNHVGFDILSFVLELV